MAWRCSRCHGLLRYQILMDTFTEGCAVYTIQYVRTVSAVLAGMESLRQEERRSLSVDEVVCGQNAGKPRGPRSRGDPGEGFRGKSTGSRAVAIRWTCVGKIWFSSHSHTRRFPQLHERALSPKSAMRTIVPFANPLLQPTSPVAGSQDHLPPPPHQHEPSRSDTPQHPDLSLLVKPIYTCLVHASVLIAV